MASRSPARAFVIEQVLADGRIPAVIGRDGTDVLTHDRLVTDAALAILVFTRDDAGSEPDGLIGRLLDGISEFADPDYPGFHELLDTTGAPQAVGMVRHPGAQALAAAAVLRANVVAARRAATSELLRHTLQRSVASGWPMLLDRTGTAVLDASSSLADVAVLVLSSQAAGTWPDDFAGQAAQQLSRFDLGDGAWALLDASGRPDPTAGFQLRSTALAALAWAALADQGVNKAAERAHALLRHVDDHHRHRNGPGFWDRADASGVVRVDPVAAYHGRARSPFPVQLAADHALLAIAAERVGRLTDHVLLKQLESDAHAFLERYTDHEVGGMFHGQGSWFSTPVDPTVPLARHVMVDRRTPGSFAVGNTSYVPFHTKHAETQLLALKASGDRLVTAPTVRTPGPALEPFPMTRDLSVASTGPLSPDLIDVPAYLRWLHSTASGLGYGLTPYRAPLGLRSDRSAQTFSVIHVVSDLRALGEPIADPDSLLAGLAAVQNPDGGFGEQPAMPSEVFTTYCAVLTAAILDAPIPHRERCLEFVLDSQHADGSFGNAPGFPGDAWHSNLAVLTLEALGARPRREADLVAYLVSCQNTDGGYGEQPGAVSDSFATFRAVDSLVALALRPSRLETTVSWLQGLQGESGGFRYRHDGVESFVGSYHAIAALYVLGASPLDTQTALHWIAGRQSRDGGFSRFVDGPSETTDEGFIAIQALHMLEGKLNPYWAVMMT